MDWVKKKMNQARIQRHRLQEKGYFDTPGNCVDENVAAPISLRADLFPLNQKLTWLASGIALGVVVVSMVWRADPMGAGDDVAGNTLEQRHQPVLLPAPSAPNEMKEELVNLTEQVKVLTTTVADLQAKLIEIHTATNSIAILGREHELDRPQRQAQATVAVTQLEAAPPPAAGLGGMKAPYGKEINKSGDITSGTLTESIKQPTGANGIQPQDTAKNSGPWVINLISSPQKLDAERYVEKAHSRGVDARLYKVTVKGKTYWRVHVPGFATAADAKFNAAAIKEKLGLNDVWVAKR